ncbi:MAG: ABC transporter ATP-binding protein [Planctomycetota bacterium]|nr:ABC transporter ATP-binding protein [Planctomycetota bacterium]MDA1164868.1 ABC transporter ATP-binding protein [Planctomycetota bacterium]
MSLSIRNLTKSYVEPGGRRLPILNVDSFDIADAEQVVLVGSSGGGKTTLLNVIAGVTTSDSGQVVIDGTDVTTLSEPARDRFRALKIGYVFQTFNLLPAFTALENVLLGMSFSGRKVDRSHALELLERVGLNHRLHHRPTKLSVGEQQRVAVARALANRPSLLLADEPTANVDTANQDNLLKLIREACTENSVSLMLVTHSQDVASQFDRVEKLSDFNMPEAAE